MKLCLPSLEAFVEELRDLKETDVRLQSNVREVPGKERRFYSYRVVVTAWVPAGVAVCSFYIGTEPQEWDGRQPEALLKKQDEVHEAVKKCLEEAGFTVKPGIWMEEGEVVDTVYHPNGKTESQTEPKHTPSPESAGIGKEKS